MKMLFRLLQRRMSHHPQWRGEVNCVAVVAATLMLNSALSANAAGSTEERVESLLAQMNLTEKIGQMTQVDSAALTNKSHIQKDALGSVLSGGSDPADTSPRNWLKLVEECQAWAKQTRLKIPLLFGVDAVDGHNNVDGAVILPHNTGLGPTATSRLWSRHLESRPGKSPVPASTGRLRLASNRLAVTVVA